LAGIEADALHQESPQERWGCGSHLRVDPRVRLRHLSHALFDGPFEAQIAIDHRPIGLRKNWHEIPAELFASLLGG
jgi:hypothetical protein